MAGDDRIVQGTEQSLDAAADAVVDLAVANCDRYMSRDERDNFRERVQDAVDALIDECRAYYRPEGVTRG